MLNETKCWIVNKQHIKKMSISEMRMLRLMGGIKNEIMR